MKKVVLSLAALLFLFSGVLLGEEIKKGDQIASEVLKEVFTTKHVNAQILTDQEMKDVSGKRYGMDGVF